MTQRQRHEQPPAPPAAATLADLPPGAEAVIRANPDRRSREMGLAAGAAVHMQRNRRNDHAVVVAAGEARFVVPRALARPISLLPPVAITPLAT